MKILIIDDNTRLRETFKKMIASKLPGTDFIEGADGHEAEPLYRAAAPDMVFMDLMMPRVNGLQATRTIKTAFPLARIVIISQLRIEEFRQIALESGAEAAFSKTELMEAIKYLTEKAAI